LKFRAETEEVARRLDWILYCEPELGQQDALSEALELWLLRKEKQWGMRPIPNRIDQPPEEDRRGPTVPVEKKGAG